ncbi:hypothetical protein [Vogesella indigofera]|uniref:hypothetical protein n=1 Tax=Vogesella indigofera TaxID=45465 RepID=UPI00234F7F9B|nr:hypothetical protein [Vogesella indigofera]MDC7708342.1 hypothetical protein [Vogesella indigofera]
MLPLRPAQRLSLLATALVAANLVHAAVPASAPFTPEQQLVLEKYQSGLADKAEDVASKLDKLEARLQSKQEYDKDVLALGQKNIDWMLGFLGLTLAAAAFLGWRTKARIESEWAAQKLEIEKEHQRAVADTDKAREALTREVGRSLAEARERLRELREELKHARSMNTEIRQIRDSANTPRADAPPEEIDAAQKENEAKAEHSPQSKLAALAQKFGKEGKWQEAASRWQALTDLEPENAAYWFNYGYVLNQWINQWTLQRKELGLIRSLADQAQAVWQQFVALKPAEAAAYNNWGNALLSLAKTETGKMQRQHLMDACNKYAESTKLQSDNAATYDNWGSALLHLINGLNGVEREAKLQEAERVLIQAKEFGHPSLYNLACLRSIQNRADDARELLQQTQANNRLARYSHLISDKDLDNLRELDWFKQFLEEVRMQEEAQATQLA